MKIKVSIFAFTCVCIAFVILFAGCALMPNTMVEDEVSMKKYSIEDFQSITIGESTYHEVYDIAPVESLHITSYGAFCDYPTQSGGYIRIKFYGKDLVVGAIEEIASKCD